ncbi:MAG: hypothetical protein HY708_05890 [Ignavibacteriae bacterium]|nr:hypothetical protein [Ignavibacteriota bacterium]
MRFPILSTIIILFTTITISACLTVESKEYHIKLKTDHSGEATIRFINILSETDDSLDFSADDFKQLIDGYLNGAKLEKENPGFHNVRKRLYEQNGNLIGEVTFTFDSLSSVRIFKYDKDSPYMFFAGNPVTSELVVESNGYIGEQWMPIVFWPKDAQELYLKTRISSDAIYRKSLLKHFQAWKTAQLKQKKQ